MMRLALRRSALGGGTSILLLACSICISLSLSILPTVTAQENFVANVEDDPNDSTKYVLTMTWTHDDSKAIVVGKSLSVNAKKAGGVCDPASERV